MSHFGKQHLHKTLCDLCADDWPNNAGYDQWDGHDEQDDDGSWDDEDRVSLPVPADTLPADAL